MRPLVMSLAVGGSEFFRFPAEHAARPFGVGPEGKTAVTGLQVNERNASVDTSTTILPRCALDQTQHYQLPANGVTAGVVQRLGDLSGRQVTCPQGS